MDLPPGVPVLDLRQERHGSMTWPRFWFGRYDEDRRGLYAHALFGGERTIHVGVDVGAPAGTPIMAPLAGTLVHQGYNPADGDYGNVLVTCHKLPSGRAIYALWGHLAATSLQLRQPGERFEAGSTLGWLGANHENGGWAPHLHLQLQWTRPDTHDMPGVVSPRVRAAARAAHPDPAIIMGPLPATPMGGHGPQG